MYTTNDNQNARFNDPEWYFLAEYPLNDLLVDVNLRNNLKTRLVLQTTQELSIPAERFKEIEEMLIGFANDVITNFIQGSVDIPATVRLFCQKKALGKLFPEKSSGRLCVERTAEQPTQATHRSDAEMNGGWGYFLIERGGSSQADSLVSTNDRVDLYLYKEGE